jgi:hypothetical protein
VDLEPRLTSEQVATLYSLRDPAAARRIMRAVGGFMVARRLFVRASDLAAWEAAQSESEHADPAPAAPPASRVESRAAARQHTTPSPAEFPLGWWRSEATDA